MAAKKLLVRGAAAVGLVVAFALAGVAVFQPRLLHLVALGEHKELRDDAGERAAAPHEPTLLVLALDGVGRELLYSMLQNGELPELAGLLGSDDGRAFPHGYLHEGLLATLPSSTLAAWAGIFTGVPSAENGVAGNEYFVRETATLAAPAPVSLTDPSTVLATYTDGYANKLLAVPTVYERVRETRRREGRPDPSIWVSMSQFHAGADRLLMAGRTVMADAFGELLKGAASDEAARGLYASLDREVIDTVVDTLKANDPPHVLTIYLTGTDHYAHGSELGPDVARRRYLREVLEPALAKLRVALDAKHALDERTVMLVSDHGHTAVLHDAEHALSTDEGGNDPPSVLRHAGYRLRPFALETDAGDVSDAVLAYGGAMAYLYLADRSTCGAADAGAGGCDWKRPPRFEEDVLPAADAFFEASRTGRGAPGLKGTLDLVLTRRPRAQPEEDLPFEVYVGHGKLEPLGAWLAAHPHPTYVDTERRLRELSVGKLGERAGDVLLLAHNGDREKVEDRYYFAELYRSWHGSPSAQDSEIPLVVAHRRKSGAELARFVRDALGDRPRQCDVAKIMLAALATPSAAGAAAADAAADQRTGR